MMVLFNTQGEIIRKLTGYSVVIPAGLVDSFQNALYNNQPVTPEAIGYIMGKLNPIYEKVKCKKCQKEIRTKEWVLNLFPDLAGEVDQALHGACYTKLKEELKALEEKAKKGVKEG